MDFINNCFEEYKSSFTNKLEDVGISGDTSNAFLSETATAYVYHQNVTLREDHSNTVV